MRTLAFLALLALVASPAFAGDCGSCGGSSVSGFDCENMCPLAHQANALRAVGHEAKAIGSKVRSDLTATVVANLSKI